MPVPRILDVQNHGKTLVVRPLDCVGNLAEPHVKAELDALIEQLHQPRVRAVVIDLEKLPYFGTNMLETMHSIWRPVRARGGRMVLCNVSDVGLEILRVARFDALWTIADTPQQALEAARSKESVA